MKTFIVASCLLAGLYGSAQSNDDFQDTRKKNESFKKLPKTEMRTDLATFTLSGLDEAVGKTEIQKIPFSAFGPDFMNFEGGNIKASIRIVPFDKGKHKLDYDEKYLVRIDRKTYYGNYGNIPTTSIGSVTVLIDNDTVAIPPLAYGDIHDLNLTYTDNGTVRSRNGVYKSVDGHTVYMYLFSKDATGSYEVTWIIQDKKYLRRVLDYGFM